MAENFLPKIFQNKFIHSVYVLTGNISAHYDWACDYIEKIQLFTHELDLLARLTRDIADYYMKKSSTEMTKNPQHTLTYLYWTRQLLLSANVVDDFVTSRYIIQCVDERIMKLERKLNSQIACEEEKFSIACTEVSVDVSDSDKD